MERGVYFDAWFPGQHCYHPSLPPRRLRMVEHLVDYHATVLVWAALGGGSISLPYLEQEAFGEIDPALPLLRLPQRRRVHRRVPETWASKSSASSSRCRAGSSRSS